MQVIPKKKKELFYSIKDNSDVSQLLSRAKKSYNALVEYGVVPSNVSVRFAEYISVNTTAFV